MTLTGYKALIPDLKGKYLFVRDSTVRNGKSFAFLDLPGGKPEGAEAPAQTVVREVKEETGLDVIVREIVGEYQITSSRGRVRCEVYACLALNDNIDITRNPASDEAILEASYKTIDDAVKERMSRSLRELLLRIKEAGE